LFSADFELDQKIFAFIIIDPINYKKHFFLIDKINIVSDFRAVMQKNTCPYSNWYEFDLLQFHQV